MNATNGQCRNKCDNYPNCKPCGEYPLFTKSITFDKEAQDALPKHIKDKMKRHREMASEKCKCTPDETTGWIEEAGHKACNICGQTQGLITKNL